MTSRSVVTLMTEMVEVLNAEKRDREGTTKPEATVTCPTEAPTATAASWVGGR